MVSNKAIFFKALYASTYHFLLGIFLLLVYFRWEYHIHLLHLSDVFWQILNSK